MFTVSITYYESQNKGYIVMGPFDGPSALAFARANASNECWVIICSNQYPVLCLEDGKEINLI